MPNRILREGILTSERVNSLSERAELFYRRLQSVVDDYGRFSANLTLLRASCYPLKLDCMKEDSIKKYLAEAEGAGLVVLYMVAGKAYLELQDFNQRIQSRSKYPAPPGKNKEENGSTVDNGEPPLKTALDGVVVEGEDVGGKKPARTRATKTPMPDDFGISDRVKDWAAAKGHTRLAEHLEAFRAKCRANGYAYADWDSAFMEAIRGDWAKLGKAGNDDSRSPASQRRLA